MGHGMYKTYIATMASNETLATPTTPAIDSGRTYANTYLSVPSGMSNSELNIMVAVSSTGSYYKVMHPAVNSAAAQLHTFAIESASTARIVPLPGGIQYLKIKSTATMQNGAGFEILCGDE